MIFSHSAATSSKSSLFPTPNIIKASKMANYNHSRSSLITPSSVARRDKRRRKCRGASGTDNINPYPQEQLSLSNYYTISSKNNPLSRVTTPISIMKMLKDSHRRSLLVTPSALRGRGTRRKWIAKKKLQRTDNFQQGASTFPIRMAAPVKCL